MATTVEAPVFRCTACHAVYTGGERFCPLDAAPIATEDRHSDPRVGRTIDGRYFVRRLIGRGGMGAVYEADHVGLDKRVAIKFLSTNLTDRESLARFRREAKVASKIVHEHVVQIFDVGTADADADFIVMEFLEGKDLAGVLREGGPIDPARTVSIIRKVLRGLRAIHAAGIVHRDIKPANILLSPRDDDKDFVKIMDFGISKSMTGADALTHTGAILGTPEYMAPEQLLADPIDQRADIYAVGLMAFRMLTGKMPFTAENTFDRSSAANPYVEVPRIGTLRPDVANDLSDALAKALAKEPDQRYPDAQAFLVALESLASPSLAPSRVGASKSSITGTEQTVAAEAVAATAIAPVTSRTVSARRPSSLPVETGVSPAAPAPTVTEQTRRSNKGLIAALGALAIVATAVVIVIVLRGGDKDVVATPAPAPALPAGGPPPTASPSNKDRVAALKQKARAAEAAGKHEDAVQAYLDAYTIEPDPSNLYAIADNYEKLKKTQDAIRYFQRYLHEDKNPPDRAAVETKIKQLETWLAAELKALDDAKKKGGGTVAPTSHPTASKKTCLCIAVGRDRRNSMSLCMKPEAPKCRCQHQGLKLCKTDVAADGSCPDASYDKYATLAKPEAACRGFRVGGSPGDAVDGTWECNVCPTSPMRTYHGEDGESCVGYYLDNGERAAKAQLLDCNE